MPVRKSEVPSVDDAPVVKKKDAISELAELWVNYVRLKNEGDKIAKEVTKQKGVIKDKFTHVEYDINGKHKEIYAPAGDGLNEVFIQLQMRESVSAVSNVVDLVRQKLGDKADTFIMKVEVLHDTALEAMLNQGLITQKDILDWTTTKEVESLIVKVNKKRK